MCNYITVSFQPVQIKWVKDGGLLPDRAIDDGRGLLVISDVKISDAGRYLCQASDGISIVVEAYNLNVEGKKFESINIYFLQCKADVDKVS